MSEPPQHTGETYKFQFHFRTWNELTKVWALVLDVTLEGENLLQ